MAYVQSSRCKKYELLTSYGEEPTQHIESEGDRLIRDLTVKQLDTKLTLEKQKKLEKIFERGSGYVPLSVHNAGCSSLQELKLKVSREENLEKLQVLGLSHKEANAVLDGEDLSFPESKVETSIKKARAEQIQYVIEKQRGHGFEGKTSVGADGISRHEKELALAVKPESTETKLLQFALSCQNRENVKKDERPLEHPINQLHELEQSLFCKHEPLKLANTVIRKRRQLLESCSPPIGPKFMKKSESGLKKSLWDQEESSFKKINSKVEKIYKCKKETFYTIKNGKIIEISDAKMMDSANSVCKNDYGDQNLGGAVFISLPSSETDEDSLQLHKLSEEEIKKLPRFNNYDKGIPSNVLYLKNLAYNVKENDLVQVFKQFQQPDQPLLKYRLMTGKMRGQAFVTFPSVKDAEEALNDVNGIILKGKPLIIQFGRTGK